jgi:cell wall-associated NlpC family hydrolase
VVLHRTATRSAVAAAAGVLALLVAGLAVPTPANADTDLTKARAQAAQLRDQVDRLDAEAEAAAEDYGDASSALDDVVARMLTSDQDVDAANLDAAVADGRKADAVRQMYMSGGPSALYASVLTGESIGDVLDRIASVEGVVRGDIVAGSDARERAAAAANDRSQAALLVAQKRVLEERRKNAAERVLSLRAQAAAALASADALVRRLVDEERAKAQAAAEAAARAAVGWGSVSVPADEYSAVDRAIAEASAAPATPYAVGALTDARRWLGTPYSAGGGGRNGPSTGWCSSLAPDDGRLDDGTCAAQSTVGFDCSSLMLRVYSAAGLSLPRTSRQQWLIGRHVGLDELQPGDLLFWAYDTGNPSSIHHVAMYLGHGLMVHAPHTGDRVRVAAVYARGLIGAVRPA